MASTEGLDDTALFASLRARKATLNEENQKLLQRWRDGKCRTSLGLELGDWVRRLALEWPLAAVGSARGGVFVANLLTNTVVAAAPDAHPAYVETDEDTMKLLYGEYDGGGTTAIAFSADRILSGGRDKTVKVWRLAPGDRTLELLAVLDCEAVPSAICLLDNGNVWAAALDGSLRRWVPNSRPLNECRGYTCDRAISAGAPVLCLAVDSARGLLACGTVEGKAAIYSLEEGTLIDTWQPHPGERVRSVAFAAGAVITGATDGTMQRRLLTSAAPGAAAALFDESALELLHPPHKAAVVSMAVHPKDPSLLVTGAIDSSLRVWDLGNPSKGRPVRCLFALVGYKVWLGSVAIDDTGRWLVSDGRDNLVIRHDFGPDGAA
eukprot:EG_transcript_9608